MRKFQSNGKTHIRLRIRCWASGVDILKFVDNGNSNESTSSSEIFVDEDEPVSSDISDEEDII